MSNSNLTHREYVEKSAQLISDLREIQKTLDVELENVKVKINPKKHGMLVKAVEEIFGDRSESPDKDYITFDMYKHCLGIMRAAGKAKAREHYGNTLVA